MTRSPGPGGLFGVAGLVGIVLVSSGPAPSSASIPELRSGPDGPAMERHPDAPPPAHTGGFGEPSCHVCHAEYELDSEYGSLALGGLPNEVAPGSVHRIRVVIVAEGTVAAGFQLSARTPDGVQAGHLRALDERVRVTPGTTPAGEILYAHQTGEGVGSGERTRTEWTVEWRAPAAVGEVVLSAAGNSGNGDNSPFGDFVWTTSTRLRVTR